MYERPDKSYFQEPVELKDLVDTKNIIQQFLPKQTDLDKILENYKKESIKGNASTFDNKRNTSWIFE